MDVELVIVLGLLAAALLAATFVLAWRFSSVRRRLHDALGRLKDARGRIEDTGRELLAAQTESRRCAEQLDLVREQLQVENQRIRTELDRRPRLERRAYRVMALGAGGSGKTSLTLRWAGPLVKPAGASCPRGERYERHERTVSLTRSRDTNVAVEHVLQIDHLSHLGHLGHLGGAQLEDAAALLACESPVHGILLVVDLGGDGAEAVDEARVARQGEAFSAAALRRLLSAEVARGCRTVVLFINKSDLLPGTPAEAEARARRHYQRLIAELEACCARGGLSLTVVVGSALSGHNVHLLSEHFASNILPAGAFDEKLLKRLRRETEVLGFGRVKRTPLRTRSGRLMTI